MTVSPRHGVLGASLVSLAAVLPSCGGAAGRPLCADTTKGCVEGRVAVDQPITIVFDDGEEVFDDADDFVARFDEVFLPRIAAVIAFDADDEVTLDPPASAAFLEGFYMFAEGEGFYYDDAVDDERFTLRGLLDDTYTFNLIRETGVHLKLINGGSWTTYNICFVLSHAVTELRVAAAEPATLSHDLGVVDRFRFYASPDYLGCDGKAKEIPLEDRTL